MPSSTISTISIHALLAESDNGYTLIIGEEYYFYPRSPCGERPQKGRASVSQRKFLSTLSLRRATADVVPVQYRRQDFYPRSPCGERRQGRVLIFRDFDFYPRSPCGERRNIRCNGGDQSYFYPRSPCGERRHPHFRNSRRLVISIHALLAESDQAGPSLHRLQDISIHALLAESDQ